MGGLTTSTEGPGGLCRCCAHGPMSPQGPGTEVTPAPCSLPQFPRNDKVPATPRFSHLETLSWLAPPAGRAANWPSPLGVRAE